MERVEGWVYCTRDGTVHEDSLNPYGYGPEGHCLLADHRPLYWRPRVDDEEHRR